MPLLANISGTWGILWQFPSHLNPQPFKLHAQCYGSQSELKCFSVDKAQLRDCCTEHTHVFWLCSTEGPGHQAWVLSSSLAAYEVSLHIHPESDHSSPSPPHAGASLTTFHLGFSNGLLKVLGFSPCFLRILGSFKTARHGKACDGFASNAGQIASRDLHDRAHLTGLSLSAPLLP